MPVLHGYKDGSGLYMLAVVSGRYTTFQLTEEGEQHVIKLLKLADEDTLSMGQLEQMIAMDMVYTDGSGPGSLATIIATYREAPPKRKIAKKKAAKPVQLPEPPILPTRTIPRVDANKYGTKGNYAIGKTLYLKAESQDTGKLDGWLMEVFRHVNELGKEVSGPIPLPTKIERYKTLRDGQSTIHELSVFKRSY